MEWKNLFRNIILERGWDYFYEEHVKEVYKTAHGFHGIVSGSEDYEVNINYQDEILGEMTCTCPYADEYNYCKHIAAVLYEIEEFGEPEDRIEVKGTKSNVDAPLEALLKGVGEPELKDFVLYYMKRDEDFALQFKQQFADKLSEEDMNLYKKKIKKLILECQDKGGFIDYNSASDLLDRLLSFIRQYLHTMLANSKYNCAFALTKYLIMELNDLTIDDSDGELTILSEACSEILRNILDHTEDQELRREIFTWLCNKMNQVNEYMTENLEDIIMEYFHENEFLEKKLEITDKIIDEYKDNESSWSAEYYLGRWVAFRLEIMYLMKMDQNEMENYQKNYWSLPEVREIFINHCIEHENYKKAIEVLQESIEMDQDKLGLVESYEEKMADLNKLVVT